MGRSAPAPRSRLTYRAHNAPNFLDDTRRSPTFEAGRGVAGSRTRAANIQRGKFQYGVEDAGELTSEKNMRRMFICIHRLGRIVQCGRRLGRSKRDIDVNRMHGTRRSRARDKAYRN